MKKKDICYDTFSVNQESIEDRHVLYLYKKYRQKIVFEMCSLSINDIISLENQGIFISPEEYIDLGG